MKFVGFLSTFILLFQFTLLGQNFGAKIEPFTLNIAGAEDITIDQETGTAYISSDDRRKWFNEKNNNIQGGIFLINLNNLEQKPSPMRIIGLPFDDFHPHGISFFKYEGKNYLYVVNHKKKISEKSVGQSSILLFEVENTQLKLAYEFYDKRLFSPNDVVGISPTEFYATNDRGSRTGFGYFFEAVFYIPKAFLVHYKEGNYAYGVRKAGYANGVQRNEAGNKIYLAETQTGKVKEFDCNPQTGALTLKQTVKLKSGVDNLEIDEQGQVWAACHSNLIKFVGHAKNPKKRSPWEVYCINFQSEPTKTTVQKVIESKDGVPYSGASVAAVWKEWVLMGAVFETNNPVYRIKK